MVGGDGGQGFKVVMVVYIGSSIPQPQSSMLALKMMLPDPLQELWLYDCGLQSVPATFGMLVNLNK
jgi:hypothetical protein